MGSAISPGWYESPPKFFRYLVDRGLPETNPVVAADRESGPDTMPAAGPTLGRWIALALAGLVALSVAAPQLRRRVLAVARAHR